MSIVDPAAFQGTCNEDEQCLQQKVIDEEDIPRIPPSQRSEEPLPHANTTNPKISKSDAIKSTEFPDPELLPSIQNSELDNLTWFSLEIFIASSASSYGFLLRGQEEK
ncbi:hypothetical protein AX17_006122 [Amanita inopinata Kibby_2008]|nr:hypothetical protein AX17_006122 [Amanita inopinata Kibby_2008]